MNDRFKFRIWDKKQKKLAYPNDNPYHNMEMVNYLLFVNNSNLKWDINNYELMQCTGLKDKNGELIYEGDIVKLYNQNYKIIYEQRGAYFGLYISKNETYYLNDINTQTSNMEIIGNIYENPELLEVNNEHT